MLHYELDRCTSSVSVLARSHLHIVIPIARKKIFYIMRCAWVLGNMYSCAKAVGRIYVFKNAHIFCTGDIFFCRLLFVLGWSLPAGNQGCQVLEKKPLSVAQTVSNLKLKYSQKTHPDDFENETNCGPRVDFSLNKFHRSKRTQNGHGWQPCLMKQTKTGWTTT